MKLLLWGGELAKKAGVMDLEAEIRRSSQAVGAEGVDHGDERDANQLWSHEHHIVMLVDFGRAALLPYPTPMQLLKLSAKKRTRKGDPFESPAKKHKRLLGGLQAV